MDGRSLSDGLHQALEAKEGLEITEENQTQASITFKTSSVCIQHYLV